MKNGGQREGYENVKDYSFLCQTRRINRLINRLLGREYRNLRFTAQPKYGRAEGFELNFCNFVGKETLKSCFKQFLKTSIFI